MKAVWNLKLRPQKNHTLAFVYGYRCKAGDSLQIGAASLYRLMINGTLRGYGPARGAHGYARVDSYDLSAYDGQKIQLTVEVFASNINSFYVVEELPFFAAELRQDGKILADAGDFRAYLLNDRVQKVQKFSFQRSFTECYHMKQCRTAFYQGDHSLFPPVETQTVSCGILQPRGVPYPALDSIFPVDKTEWGRVDTDPTLPLWQDRSLNQISERLKGFAYEELTECLSDQVSQMRFRPVGKETQELSGNTYQVYHFGRTITGFFHTCLKVQEKTVFYILFDEVLSEGTINPFRNGCCNVIKYRLEPGVYHLTAFEANSAQYAALAVTEGRMEIRDFHMISYENPEIARFHYETGDQELDDIIAAARNTLAQNAVDVLTDCPSRERAGWPCDSYFSGMAEWLFTGKNAVEHNFLENYMLSPQSEFLPEGMLPMCYPADHNDRNFLPNWSLWLILELQTYINRTGDREMAELAEPRIRRLLRYFSRYENGDGLLEDLDGWIFVEWSRCNDYVQGVNYPTNMLYAAALETVGNLYGQPEKIKKAEAIRRVIRQQSFNGSFFEDNRVRENGVLVPTGHVTETCQYYAFYFKTAPVEAYPELYSKMLRQFGPNRDVQNVYPDIWPSNAIMGNSLRLLLLLQSGAYDRVIAECRAFYAKMARTTGTLWEHDRLRASLNHGFASAAAWYLICALEKK